MMGLTYYALAQERAVQAELLEGRPRPSGTLPVAGRRRHRSLIAFARGPVARLRSL
jgi:hypothetical protein